MNLILNIVAEKRGTCSGESILIANGKNIISKLSQIHLLTEESNSPEQKLIENIEQKSKLNYGKTSTMLKKILSLREILLITK